MQYSYSIAWHYHQIILSPSDDLCCITRVPSKEELDKRLASQDIDLSNAQNNLKVISEVKSTPKCEHKETKSSPPTLNKSNIESEKIAWQIKINRI